VFACFPAQLPRHGSQVCERGHRGQQQYRRQHEILGVPEGFTFPKEGGAKEQSINRYVVAAKGQTLVIHNAGTPETPVAFFQCASLISAFDVAGANVAVGCADGQVLQLFAAVLQSRGVGGGGGGVQGAGAGAGAGAGGAGAWSCSHHGCSFQGSYAQVSAHESGCH
jgi:hypothetical protein